MNPYEHQVCKVLFGSIDDEDQRGAFDFLSAVPNSGRQDDGAYPQLDYTQAAPDSQVALSALKLLLSLPPSSFGQATEADPGFQLPTAHELEETFTRTRQAYRDLRLPILLSETFYGMRSAYLKMPFCVQFVRCGFVPIPLERAANAQMNLVKCTFAGSLTEASKICALRSNSLALLHLPTDSLVPFAPSRIELKLGQAKVNDKCILGYIGSITLKPERAYGNCQPMWSLLDGTGVPILGDGLQLFELTLAYIANDKSEKILNKMKETFADSADNTGVLEITFIGSLQHFFQNVRMISLPERPAGVAPDADRNVSPLYDLAINPFSELAGGSTFRQLGERDQEFFNRLSSEEKPTISAITGGPGTGKTSTVFEFVKTFVTEHSKIGGKRGKIAFFAQNNELADQAYLQFASFEETAVRLGEKSRFSREVAELMKSRRDLYIRVMCDLIQNPPTAEQAEANFYSQAMILVSTLSSAQCSMFTRHRQEMEYQIAVIDNAERAHETELLLPLHLPKLRHLILVGDPAQLGPTIFTPALQSYPMSAVSPFSRLVQALPRVNCLFLISQQHMRPLVASLATEVSLGGPAEPFFSNWEIIRQQIPASVLRLPPLLVFSAKTWCSPSARLGSLKETTGGDETSFVILLLRAALLQMGYKPEDPPLVARQEGREEIRLRIGLLAMEQTRATKLKHGLESLAPQPGVQIYVGTVESAIGRFFDVVILTTVFGEVERRADLATILSCIGTSLSRGRTLYIVGHYLSFGMMPGWSKICGLGIQRNMVHLEADQFDERHLCKFLEAKRVEYAQHNESEES